MGQVKLVAVVVMIALFSVSQFCQAVEWPAGCTGSLLWGPRKMSGSSSSLRAMAEKVTQLSDLMPEGFSGKLVEACQDRQLARVIPTPAACNKLEDIVVQTTKRWQTLTPPQREALISTWVVYLKILADEMDTASRRPCGVPDEAKSFGGDLAGIARPIVLPFVYSSCEGEACEGLPIELLATPFIMVWGAVGLAGDIVTAPLNLVLHGIRRNKPPLSQIDKALSDFMAALPTDLRQQWIAKV